MPNPTKPSLKTEILPLIFLIITGIASFYFYQNFPEIVPTHWNVAGEADGWSSKAVGAFAMPIMMIGIYILFSLLPYLDPRKDRYAQFNKVYHFFKFIIILFIGIIYFLGSLNGLGYQVPIDVYVPVLLGILFVIIGNYLSKIKPNWFMGIRTPWTLSSEEVWNKTHRMSGWLFILGGITLICEPLLPISWRVPVLFLVITILVIGSMGYSYWIYSQKK